MCVNCITGYEAVALNSVALAAAGSSLWQRLMAPGSRDRARRQAWNENASLMRSMGLDPEAVLGPPPEVEHQHLGSGAVAALSAVPENAPV